MTRPEFKTVVKCISVWKVDKRKGNYKLPSGARLTDYLEEMTLDFLKRMDMAITKNGNVVSKIDDKIFISFGDNEEYHIEEQIDRVEKLVKEIVF